MNGSLTIYCGNALLCDGSPTGGRCESLIINGSALVDDARYIDAAWIEFIDRAGKSNDVQFVVTTQHADQVDALAFVGELRENIAGVIDLTITLTLDSGKSVTLYAANAGWKRIQAGANGGMSSRVSYPVNCGQLATLTEGSGGLPFAIPYEADNKIDPLIVPSGFAASLANGEDSFAFGAQLQGSLSLNSGSRLILIGRP